MKNLESIFNQIEQERRIQKMKWGDDCDVNKPMSRFVELITTYSLWAKLMWEMQSPDKARRRMIQVATLAVAAVEEMDRQAAEAVRND